MRKILTIILFALMVIPVNAEEEITYYGVYCVSNFSVNPPPGVPQPHSGTRTLRFLNNGDVEMDGVIYEEFYGTSYEGVTIGGSGITVYKLSSPINTESDKYKFLCVKDDKSAIQLTWFNSYLSGWYGKCIAFGYRRSGGASTSPGYNSTPNNSGYNSSTPSEGRTCAGCRGTGVCTMCNGKGGYWTNSGTYTGSGSKTWHQCSSCHGSGKCGVCYGKGTIR